MNSFPASLADAKWLFMSVARSVCPDYTVLPEYHRLLNDLLQWCLMIPGTYDPDKGLWLYGNIGTGKTTLLEIVRQYCGIVRPFDGDGFPYSFRTTNTIEVCAAFQDRGYCGIGTYISSRRQAFDELGSESVPTGYYGSAENVMQYILQRRYDKRYDSFTHVTTNLALNEIAPRYGARIYDRCKEMFNFVLVEGKTFR